jgi:hypothetical protein
MLSARGVRFLAAVPLESPLSLPLKSTGATESKCLVEMPRLT